MYATSSQRKYWTFKSDQEISELRLKHNQAFVAQHGANLDVCIAIRLRVKYVIAFLLQEELQAQCYLSPTEEKLLLKNYELHLRDFCRRFDPPMPKCIVGTAFHYFKRFYLFNSTMDFHPKEIL